MIIKNGFYHKMQIGSANNHQMGMSNIVQSQQQQTKRTIQIIKTPRNTRALVSLPTQPLRPC